MSYPEMTHPIILEMERCGVIEEKRKVEYYKCEECYYEFYSSDGYDFEGDYICDDCKLDYIDKHYKIKNH